jgi:hypothetical protein
MKNILLRSKYLFATALSFLSNNTYSADLDQAFPGYVSEGSRISSIETLTATNVPVNESYCYTAFDINCFLNHRFKGAPWISVVPWIPDMPDIDLFTERKRRLEEENADKGDKSRIILTPYVDQRLGVFAVSIIKNGRGVSGVVIPSIKNAEIPADLETFMKSIYGVTFSFQVLHGYYLLENRLEDQGVVTLENLFAFGSKGGISGFPIVSTLAFRHRHIEESTDPIMGTPIFPTEGFYEFPKRQARNLPVITYLLPNSRLCWAEVRPFELTVSHKDRKRIESVMKILSSISKTWDELPRKEDGTLNLTGEEHSRMYEESVRGPFLNLFGNIDGSIEATINFGLQQRYKQIPWHLLPLHWWQSSNGPSSGLIDLIIGTLARPSSSGMTGFRSLEQMLLKVVGLETLTANDLYGINILKPFWEYRYVRAVLQDLTNRIILIVDAEKGNTRIRRLSVIRLLQVSGEYFKKLKHIPAFSELLTNLDPEKFRNILSHLENLPNTIDSILNDTNLHWSAIYQEVCSLGLILRDIQSYTKIPFSNENPDEQWRFICIKRPYKSIEGIISGLKFPKIATLREALSKANPSLIKKEKSSMTVLRSKAFATELSHEATQRDKIQKILSDKEIDKSDFRRVHQYFRFIHDLHDECSLAFNREGFWEEKTTCSELLFHQMRGKSIDNIDTPLSKRSYRLELLDSAINLLEWVRRLLGVEDIKLTVELESINEFTEWKRKELAEIIIKDEGVFNRISTPKTDLRLQNFLDNNPSGLFTLEFLIGAAYEALQNIFYFPEFSGHYLHNKHVRNYYDHPDPTYLKPFIVWEAQEISSGDGRDIFTRPDRDSAFQKVLLQEASRLLVPLHHVLLAIRDQMLTDPTKNGFVDAKLQNTQEES